MRWNGPDGPSLNQLLRQIPKSDGRWFFNTRFEQINVAVESGIPRMSDFDALDPMDRAYLIARYRTRQKMATYEAWLQQKELQRARNMRNY